MVAAMKEEKMHRMARILFLFCILCINVKELISILPYAPYDRCVLTISWTGGSFCWPCPSTKSIYIKSGHFISKNVIGTRAQIYKDDAFIVLPRFKSGIPATLVKTSLKDRTCQALLEPFPNLSLNEECKPNAIQNAVDLVLDAQDLLWILDVGIVNTLEQPIQRGCPKILVFSVKLCKLLKVIDLSGLVLPASRLQYLVVDYAPDGRPFVYISDAAARAILVYDVAAGKGYRVVLPNAVVCGCQNRRDVLYIALARKCDGSTVLYFTYLSGSRLFAIKTEYLRRGACQGYVEDIGIKPGRIIILGTDNGSAMFFRYEGKGNIFRWDTNTPFIPANVVLVYRSDDCLLATHVMADYKRGRMRVLKSNFHDYIQGTVGCGAVQNLSIMENFC
ncbi:protein yellow-like [Lycorma delicatula]|uniref:protein yellow-like n=1 Tax=Lycorma delicatula TaxID=130591 RepID=UPI003F50E60B